MIVVVRKGAPHVPPLVVVHAQGIKQAVHRNRPRVVGIVEGHFALGFLHFDVRIRSLPIRQPFSALGP